MNDYTRGFDAGLVAGAAAIAAIDDLITVALADQATAYDLGYIAGLAAAKVRAGDDG